MKRLLLAVLVSCAPYQFAVDPAFTPPERADIEQAAAQWNARTKGRRITFDGSVWRVERTDVPAGFIGWTSRGSKLIQIEPGHNTLHIALHEFGHALGLRHVCGHPTTAGKSTGAECIPGQPAGVMDPINGSTEFSEADLAECRHAGACP